MDNWDENAHEPGCHSDEHDEDGVRYGCSCVSGLRSRVAALGAENASMRDCIVKALELVEDGAFNMPSWTYLSFRDAIGLPVNRI